MHNARPHFHRTLARSAAALLLLAAAACGDSGNPAGPGGGPVVNPQPAVAEVDLSATELVLPVGDQHQLFVFLKAADGTEIVGRAVTWASSDPSVATVDATGRITGHRAGTATVSATSEGKRDEALVKVPLPVARVELGGEMVNLKPDQEHQLRASLVSPDGEEITNRLVSWITSDPTIAGVSSEGLVTGIRGGRAWVHAWSEGKSDSVLVQVAMTANPDEYGLLFVDGRTVGQDKIVYDTLTWTDPQGAAHPAQELIIGGKLTFSRSGGKLFYEQRFTIATFLVDASGEIRVRVGERVLVDRGEVTERPMTGYEYLFRSTATAAQPPFFGVGIGVERIGTYQAIDGGTRGHDLVFTQW
jgi:hypothetical protein